MRSYVLFKLTIHLLFTTCLTCTAAGQAVADEIKVPEVKLRPISKGNPELIFEHDVSAILGADDAYTLSYSKFDYASKYRSDTPLNPAERTAFAKKALDEFSPKEIQKLREAFDAVFIKMEGMKANLPETIYIFSERTIESGAPYTRANAICMPKTVLGIANKDEIKDLAAHELFHVMTRYNPELRTPIFATLGYLPVGQLVLTGDLATRTIANPDAPENTHAITCTLNDETLRFMPILYSKRDFPKGGISFFQFLNDDLIAVNIVDEKPVPIERDGKPFIVEKEQLKDYFDQIGRNTEYTFHPEETSADHFKQLLFWDLKELPNPENIKSLEEILRK